LVLVECADCRVAQLHGKRLVNLADDVAIEIDDKGLAGLARIEGDRFRLRGEVRAAGGGRRPSTVFTITVTGTELALLRETVNASAAAFPGFPAKMFPSLIEAFPIEILGAASSFLISPIASPVVIVAPPAGVHQSHAERLGCPVHSLELVV
jgi:hypothetical protein